MAHYSSRQERLQNISEICNAPIVSADGIHDHMRANFLSSIVMKMKKHFKMFFPRLLVIITQCSEGKNTYKELK